MGNLGQNGSGNALVPARRRELIADRLREQGAEIGPDGKLSKLGRG